MLLGYYIMVFVVRKWFYRNPHELVEQGLKCELYPSNVSSLSFIVTLDIRHF